MKRRTRVPRWLVTTHDGRELVVYGDPRDWPQHPDLFGLRSWVFGGWWVPSMCDYETEVERSNLGAALRWYLTAPRGEAALREMAEVER